MSAGKEQQQRVQKTSTKAKTTNTSTYEELANAARALGGMAARLDVVGESRDVLVTLLHDDEVKNREVVADDAAANRLALALTALALAVAREALAHEEANAALGEDTLLHGETLEIVTTRDLEDVALELVAKDVALNLVRNALIDEGAAARPQKTHSRITTQ